MNTVNLVHNTGNASTKKYSLSGISKFWNEVMAHKLLFITFLVLCMTGAYILNETSTPYYIVESSMIIKEGENIGNKPSAMLLTKENPAPFGMLANPLEEVAVLQSHPFVLNTLKSLNLNISYFEVGKFRNDEILPGKPFLVKIHDTTNLQNLYKKKFTVVFHGKDEFVVVRKDKETGDESKMPIGKQFLLENVPVSIVLGNDTKALQTVSGKQYEFEVHDLAKLAFKYKSNLSIFPLDEESPVLMINLKSALPEQGKAFLNALTKQYIINKYEEKSRSAGQALLFINEQINSVKGTLGSAESNLASFRANNTFTDAQEMANRNLNAISQLEEQKANHTLMDRYYSKVLDDLNQNTAGDQLIAPSSVGVTDNLTEGLIKQLADLQLEKNSYAANGGSKNPLIQEIDIKIKNVKSSLRDNINSLASSNRTKLNQINARTSQFQTKVFNIPIADKRFTEIKRSTEFNDALYQFLMQKRVEAGILKASATVSDKIIEPAYLPLGVPVAPKKANNYALGVLLGFLLPFGIVRIKKAVNKKVTTKEEILQQTSMPVLGNIFHNQKQETLVVGKDSRTAVAESFRMLRSNLSVYLKNTTDKIIVVSSSDSGEGKSFVSTNLGLVYAAAKRKTILINLDLRVPSDIYKEFGDCERGISDFLNSEIALKDIIQKTEYPYLDVIHTGALPDNPAELIMDNKLEFLLEFLKGQYDLIIIDTPPLGVVADPFILTRFASLTLVVARENYTNRQRLDELEEMYNTGKFTNVAMVINDVHLTAKGYKNAYYYSK